MIKYQFKDDLKIIRNGKKADPQKIGESIASIQAKHNGRLKPEYLWQEARGNKRHTLYSFFNWDVERAAQAHWTDQARHIIGMIREEPSGDEIEPQPAFISINDKGTAYRAKLEVVNSAALQLIVMRNAQRDLDAFQRRYRELHGICGDYIAQAQQALATKRAAMEAQESRVSA